MTSDEHLLEAPVYSARPRQVNFRAKVEELTQGLQMREEQWFEKLTIQELCARWCHAIDSQDADGWAHCFTTGGCV